MSDQRSSSRDNNKDVSIKAQSGLSCGEWAGTGGGGWGGRRTELPPSVPRGTNAATAQVGAWSVEPPRRGALSGGAQGGNQSV